MNFFIQLDKYLDRSYWEKKNQESATRAPSAPVVVETQPTPSAQQQVVTNGDVYANVQPYQTPQGAVADVVEVCHMIIYYFQKYDF